MRPGALREDKEDLRSPACPCITSASSPCVIDYPQSWHPRLDKFPQRRHHDRLPGASRSPRNLLTDARIDVNTNLALDILFKNDNFVFYCGGELAWHTAEQAWDTHSYGHLQFKVLKRTSYSTLSAAHRHEHTHTHMYSLPYQLHRGGCYTNINFYKVNNYNHLKCVCVCVRVRACVRATYFRYDSVWLQLDSHDSDDYAKEEKK